MKTILRRNYLRPPPRGVGGQFYFTPFLNGQVGDNNGENSTTGGRFEAAHLWTSEASRRRVVRLLAW